MKKKGGKREKSFLSISFDSVLSFAIFLVLLFILSVLPIENTVYQNFVGYFIYSLPIIIFYTLFFYFANVLFSFGMPANLFAPIFNAFGALFLIWFVYGLFEVLVDFTAGGMLSILWSIYPFISGFVFLIVLVVGYIRVFFANTQGDYVWEEKNKKRDVSWDDVGDEFRHAFYNLGRRIRRSLDDVGGGNKSEK